MPKINQSPKKLSDEEFVCSAGQFDRFKVRLDTHFGKANVGAKPVHSGTRTDWLTAVWPKFSKCMQTMIFLTPMRQVFSLDWHRTGH
jgi:hypothetical protein